MNDRLVREISRLHTQLFRISGGRVGSRLVNNDMLLLTTRGRSTGDPHTVPLLYLEDDERLVVIASYGGRDHHPEWYHNLTADPAAEVEIMGSGRPVTAETMPPEPRTAWWPKVVEAYSGYEAYQARTDREIPIVWLHPREEGGDDSRPPR